MRRSEELKGRTYKELELGGCFGDSIEITEQHVTDAARLFRDYNPMHMDEDLARRSVFGRRILHGPCVVGLMMGTIGDVVAGTGIAELGLTFEFRAPTLIGDTLSWEWTVTGRNDNAKHHGGLVTFAGRCVKQDGTLVATGVTNVLVRSEAF